jgi:glycerol-3-phosphate dehydrogenase (NAD(P)+)
MKIVVIGAGAWGTALAVSAAQRADSAHAVTLSARNPEHARIMEHVRENARYLSGISLPPSLTICADTAQSLVDRVHDAQLIVVATPLAGLRDVLTPIRGCKIPVAWLCKGVESAVPSAHGLLPHEIQRQVAPSLRAAVLSGPSFAMEVARQQPTALVASSVHAEVRRALVEVGGAVKNVLAIATGLCDGLNLGANARAALITRGLAEMTRFGIALGAKPETFMGLSGLGDLVLTATGDLSRNRKVGLLLAQGQSLQQAVDSLGHVAEGVYCARAVVQRAASLGVEMPIAAAVVALLDGQMSPAEAVATLMGRGARGEANATLKTPNQT